MRHAPRIAAVSLCAAALLACGGSSPQTPSVDAGLPPGGGGDAGHHGAAPTWHKDVLPIVQDSCLGCHAEGGIGPFALATYDQAKAMHLGMADAVVQKRMPPWMADPSCREYEHERRLTDAQIATITAWSEAGAPEGDPKDAPAEPPPPQALPWVSATLDPGVDYTPSTAAGTDDYHCFILDPALTQAAHVIGFDIVPGERKMVHHVLLYAVPRTAAQSKDAQTPDVPGWTCFGATGTGSDNVVGGWVPGTPVTRYPEGTGVRVAATDVLVMQIHYNTLGGAVPDRTRVRLQYAQGAVQQALILPQAHAAFAIPPQSEGYQVTTTDPGSRVAATVYGVLPHMHQLGRNIRVEVAQTGECLVDIPKWDFHWQQFYMLKEPVKVLPGQSRKMTCGWDNPTPQTVTWGEGTAEEMCLNYVYVTLP